MKTLLKFDLKKALREIGIGKATEAVIPAKAANPANSANSANAAPSAMAAHEVIRYKLIRILSDFRIGGGPIKPDRYILAGSQGILVLDLDGEDLPWGELTELRRNRAEGNAIAILHGKHRVIAWTDFILT